MSFKHEIEVQWQDIDQRTTIKPYKTPNQKELKNRTKKTPRSPERNPKNPKSPNPHHTQLSERKPNQTEKTVHDSDIPNLASNPPADRHQISSNQKTIAQSNKTISQSKKIYIQNHQHATRTKQFQKKKIKSKS